MTHGDFKRKETNKTEEYSAGDMLQPPDGGFGWVVVMASFLIHVISMSFIKSHFCWLFFMLA